MGDVGESSVGPTFSVVMPVYNCRPWIREAVLSVLAQTERDFELIVVDDCSTDGSLEAIADLASADGRIRLVRRSVNGHAAATRNTGLETSTGRFIAFLDADDVWEPTRLALHRAVFDAFPQTTMVFSDFRGFGSEMGEEPPYLGVQRDVPRVAASHLDGPHALPGTGLTVYKCRPTLSTFIALHYNVLYMHCVTLARDAVLAQPNWFPTNLTVCEDLEFFQRILQSGPTIFLPEALAWYRWRPGSLTNTGESFFRGMIEFHTANRNRHRTSLTTEEVRAYDARIASFRQSLARQLGLRGAAGEARRQYWLAFRGAPTWSGAKALAKSLVPAQVMKAAKLRLRRPT